MNLISCIKKKYWNADGWINGFDKTKSIFIHIPKAAGTSISDALYGEDPWHYTINHYKFLSCGDFEKYFKFGFVRNPYNRLYSIYNYGFKQSRIHPSTSIAFITEFPSFENFITNWLTHENINKHYFFYPQTKYLCSRTGQLLVDYVGRFESINQDFKVISNRIQINKQLKHMNKSEYSAPKSVYTPELAEKVYDAYKYDFDLFSYNKDSWKEVY